MQEQIDNINKKLDKIITNDLHHIHINITRLDERIKLVLWVLGVVAAVVIANLLKK